MLEKYGSLDAIVENPQQLATSGLRGSARLAEKLEQYRDQILMARQLTTTATDAETGICWSDMQPGRIQLQSAAALLSQHGLGKLVPLLKRSKLCRQ